jgi:hypothetical protein
MSLGIAFKGPEGLVLAADSRVTLLAQIQGLAAPQGVQVLVPATFDNATKLLSVPSQNHVAAITYGAGAIGLQAPRTAASFMPEFDFNLTQKMKGGRLTVEQFAKALSDFFAGHWAAAGMPAAGTPVAQNQDMIFIVAGYDDEKAPYGRIYEVKIPSSPTPGELLPGNQFGAAWGGQREMTDRLLQGFDQQVPMLVQKHLNVPVANQEAAAAALSAALSEKLTIPIPWQFLPLQDCVDLSIFLLRTTITLQKWTVGIRGVGGAIDLATITRTGGFVAIQQKRIFGEQTQDSMPTPRRREDQR